MIPADARRPLFAAATVAAAAGGLWLLRTFDPNAPDSIFPPCLFRTFTGLFCPGCGITRMLHALAHGDLVRAAEMNAMVLLMLPAVAMLAINEFASRRILPRGLATPLYSARLWLSAVVVFGVLRNLPWAPFRALAPG